VALLRSMAVKHEPSKQERRRRNGLTSISINRHLQNRLHGLDLLRNRSQINHIGKGQPVKKVILLLRKRKENPLKQNQLLIAYGAPKGGIKMATPKFTAIKAKKIKSPKRGGRGAKYPTQSAGGKAKKGKS